MKKRTKFYALLFAMVLSLTQMIGAAVPVKAATKEWLYFGEWYRYTYA